jgi:hypothetical protein
MVVYIHKMMWCGVLWCVVIWSGGYCVVWIELLITCIIIIIIIHIIRIIKSPSWWRWCCFTSSMSGTISTVILSTSTRRAYPSTEPLYSCGSARGYITTPTTVCVSSWGCKWCKRYKRCKQVRGRWWVYRGCRGGVEDDERVVSGRGDGWRRL